MPKLSVVIITFNEEKNIGRCLESVKGIADDIVVVDSFSTDKTANICNHYKVNFIQHKWEGYSATKNFANSQAVYDWILSLDADEELSDKLKESIREVKQKGELSSCEFNRLTNYCGKWIKHCGWFPDTKVRIFDRRDTYWEGTIHEKLKSVSTKQVKKLAGDCLHYSYYTTDDHYKQVYYFTDILARAQYKEGKTASVFRLYLSPVVKFLRDYILKLGILDGKAGFSISRISAYATYLKYKQLRTLHNSKGLRSKENIKRIIISRTDAIGDVILTLPVCGLIKKYYPGTEIIFLGKTYTQSVINCCEHIDTFLNADELLKLKDEEACRQLKALDTDAIIHVFPNKRIAKLAKMAGINLRIGTRNRLFHWFTVNRLVRLSRKNSDLHEAQLNCKLLAGIGIKRCPELKELAVFTGFTKIPSASPATLELIDSTKINVIFHPKSNASAREWSLDNFKALANLLPCERFKLFISGTDKEQIILADWIKSMPEHVKDITGKLSLEEFIAFISKADCLVAASTGPLHISAATGIGAVGIYPPIRSMHPGRWQPVGKKVTVACVNKSCSDCRNQPQQCHCMNEVTPLQIASIIKQHGHR